MCNNIDLALFRHSLVTLSDWACLCGVSASRRGTVLVPGEHETAIISSEKVIGLAKIKLQRLASPEKLATVKTIVFDVEKDHAWCAFYRLVARVIIGAKISGSALVSFVVRRAKHHFYDNLLQEPKRGQIKEEESFVCRHGKCREKTRSKIMKGVLDTTTLSWNFKRSFRNSLCSNLNL